MKNISFDYSKANISRNEILGIQKQVMEAHRDLHSSSGLGNDFLGWMEYSNNYSKEELNRIRKAAKNIQENSDAFIVIGIGGSYLGARAAIEVLTHSFYNLISNDKRKTPQIYFSGNNISATYLKDLLDTIDGKDISVNVISKSGTTTETAIVFRILKEYMENKYGKEGAKKRIYATTDRSRGALKKLASQEGYETFVIPDDIGGRYSIFTPVGLLPIAVAGIDINSMLKGAQDGVDEFKDERIQENPCYQYAAARNILYRKGKDVEILAGYEPFLNFLGEWWKQLFGESEGKDGKGIYPAYVNFSTDLHSLGQYIQDGRRILFETVINIKRSRYDFVLEENKEDLDGLNYLSGKTMDFVNKKAMEGTILAHVDGGVPNLKISVPEMNAYYFGKLIYFFMKACAISGYLLGVNPFNQPGVDSYKKNMFALLGKPGFEDLKLELEKRLK